MGIDVPEVGEYDTETEGDEEEQRRVGRATASTTTTTARGGIGRHRC